MLELFEEHAKRQQKYFSVDKPFTELPIEERAYYIKLITSYLVEECYELYVETKNNALPLPSEKEYLELADIFIYGMGLAVVSGIDLENLVKSIETEDSIRYNISLMELVGNITQVNRCLNHLYKPFKPKSTIKESNLFYYILTFFINYFNFVKLYYGSEKTFKAINQKLDYNSTRNDHAITA